MDDYDYVRNEYDTWWAYNNLHIPGCAECGYGHKRVRCAEGERLHQLWMTALIAYNEYMESQGYVGSFIGGWKKDEQAQPRDHKENGKTESS